MCRYAVTTYKPHYACFACRKAFRRRLRRDIARSSAGAAPDRPARCPQCGLLMADMGLDFKAPPKDDDRAWELVARLWEVGFTFHSCGCGGPGYRPREPRAFREFLTSTRAQYAEQLRSWQELEPEFRSAAEHQRAAVARWRERIQRIDAALASS